MLHGEDTVARIAASNAALLQHALRLRRLKFWDVTLTSLDFESTSFEMITAVMKELFRYCSATPL